jgi:opacity protein-like surface antigen
MLGVQPGLKGGTTMRVRRLYSLGFVLALALSGCAGQDGRFAREGFSIGAGAGLALEQFDVDEAEDLLGVNVSVDDSFTLEGRAGYRFHPHFALEGVYQHYDEFQIEALGTDILSIDGWSATANLKGYLLTGRIQPYGLAGIGILDLEIKDDVGAGLEADESDVLTRFGLGVDAYVTEGIVVFVEGAYNLPLDDLDDLPFISATAGLQFRF